MNLESVRSENAELRAACIGLKFSSSDLPASERESNLISALDVQIELRSVIQSAANLGMPGADIAVREMNARTIATQPAAKSAPASLAPQGSPAGEAERDKVYRRDLVEQITALRERVRASVGTTQPALTGNESVEQLKAILANLQADVIAYKLGDEILNKLHLIGERIEGAQAAASSEGEE